MILRDYAQTHDLCVVGEYVDDGWSGTNYDRPGFQRLLGDVMSGKINCVVVKDLSRFARNYSDAGSLIDNLFVQMGVRFISLAEGVDSYLNPDSVNSIIVPITNVMNEMHARQTSKKVKAALHTRRMNGAHWGPHTPLGYRRDPDQKGHLLIDPETRWIVEKIFDLAFHGMGAAKITRILVQEQVPTPGWLHYSRDGTYAHIYQDAPERKRYDWNVAAVKKILKDENYIGNSIHNRLSIMSFKNKKLTRNPASEWIRVENTHEAIIPHDVFEQVQGQIASRRREQKDGTTQMFAGLLRCAGCGWTMRFGRQSSGSRAGYYACGKYYNTVDRQCSMHFIRYDALYAYVLDRLQFWAALAVRDEEQLLERLLQNGSQSRVTEHKKQKAELRKAEKRKATVDSLFVKMYEDWSAGRITESNFNLLSERYQTEQVELDTKIASLKAAMESDEQSAEDAGKWIKLIRQYSEITELDAPLLNTLIEKIVVHKATKGPDGVREQEVEIFYRFVGKIDL